MGASYKITPAFTVHAGVQNLLDKRLNYDTAGYLIDPARVWMGVGVRF
jgi:outer membrane receptor for ferrienterochelin and colicins